METETSSRSYRWLLWVTALVVWATDQLTKTLVIQNLALGDSWRPYAGTPILELFALTHTKNSGAAFGMLPDAGLFFILVAVVVSLGIVWYYPRLDRSKALLFLSLGLMLGGALGNLTDRLRIGWVTDFVHIGSFAIFNVADSAVFCGVLALAFQMWREDEAKRHQEQQRSVEVEPAPRLISSTAFEEDKRERPPFIERSGARVYNHPTTNGHARLEHTTVVWSNQKANDDGIE
jgi:signal peptidase II